MVERKRLCPQIPLSGIIMESKSRKNLTATWSLCYIEDSDDDLFTVSRMLKRWCKNNDEVALTHFYTVEEALNHLTSPTVRHPDLFLVDLNLDGHSGYSFLSQVQELKNIDTARVVLSSSRNREDIARAYRHGAAGYLHKHVDHREFERRFHTCLDYWFSTIELPKGS